jgi:multiple antibiotic resistance protein
MRAVCQDTARIAMLETALIAFTTYFATIGPADVAALFAALTPTTRRPSGVRWRSRAR